MLRISVYGLWRDAEKYINRSLSCLHSLLDIKDTSFSFSFYENDSTDNTRSILKQWCGEGDNRNLIYEDLGFPKFGSVPDIERLILLSHYRNKFHNLFSKDTSDYSLLLDTDIIFNKDHFLTLLDHIERLKAVAVIANTRQKDIPDLMLDKTTDSFYDVFCLRDRFFNNGLYFTDCPFIMNEDRESWESDQPVEILSGFSGFCLAKTEYLKDCRWSTCSQSEHVNFFLQLQKYGKIFLVPSCKPYTEIDISKISIESCKNIAKQQLQMINQINHIFRLSTQDQLK